VFNIVREPAILQHVHVLLHYYYLFSPSCIAVWNNLDGKVYIEHHSLNRSGQSGLWVNQLDGQLDCLDSQLRYASSGASCSDSRSVDGEEGSRCISANRSGRQGRSGRGAVDHLRSDSEPWTLENGNVLQSAGSLDPQTGEGLAFHPGAGEEDAQENVWCGPTVVAATVRCCRRERSVRASGNDGNENNNGRCLPAFHCRI
jgi:hypothetical protein